MFVAESSAGFQTWLKSKSPTDKCFADGCCPLRTYFQEGLSVVDAEIWSDHVILDGATHKNPPWITQTIIAIDNYTTRWNELTARKVRELTEGI